MANRQTSGPSEQVWTIHNILATLVAALPMDSADSEVPARGLLFHVLDLTESLALALAGSDPEVTA